MTIQTIPLNLLVPSPDNVRKTGASAGIEELVASIEAHGLLQNVQVRPATKGKFEVVAGGRRLAALNILRRQKKLAKDFPVPCHVLDDQDAHEISLAENTVRLAMHPADQFVAFHALVEQGKGVEEIAARFGISPVVVRQRLKLASVSPTLIALYRDEEMTLDQLMAFTVSDDHRAQEAAWFDQPDYNRRPHAIRAALTAAQVEADDRRVRFVTLDAYLAAGGGLNRDLFQSDHEGYLTDPGLLDRLVTAKLAVAADEVRGEGWAWVETVPLRDRAAVARFGRVHPDAQPLDDAMCQKRNDLTAAYDALLDEHGDDPEPEIAEQLDGLSNEIESIEQAAMAWSTDDLAHAGAVLSLDYDGDLIVERGLVRPDDMRQLRAAARDGAGMGADGAEIAAKPSGLSAALVESLTAERTAALRAQLLDDQTVALAGLAHALALSLFYGAYREEQTCLQLRLTSRDLTRSAPRLDETRASRLLAERHEAWTNRLPNESGDLFDWLLGQDAATILELLAYCAAQGIDAVRCKADRATAPRLLHADRLAKAIGLDMRDWWSPTKDNYLGRVSKALVLEAIREGVSPEAAENLAALKKDGLTEAAEQRLTGRGWLPTLLRSHDATEGESAADMKAAA